MAPLGVRLDKNRRDRPMCLPVIYPTTIKKLRISEAFL